MKTIAERVRDGRASSTELQEAPVLLHQAGGVKRFRRQLQELAWAIKSSLEAKLGTQLGAELGLVSWLIWHSSLLIHRSCVPDGTGRTALAVALR